MHGAPRKDYEAKYPGQAAFLSSFQFPAGHLFQSDSDFSTVSLSRIAIQTNLQTTAYAALDAWGTAFHLHILPLRQQVSCFSAAFSDGDPLFDFPLKFA